MSAVPPAAAVEKTIEETLNESYLDANGKVLFQRTELVELPGLTAELRKLKEAQLKQVEDSTLSYLDVDVGLGMFGLTTDIKKLYIRQGFQSLYDLLGRIWRSEEPHRVGLIGNAGTGKSWYQVYVLRRLRYGPLWQ